MKKRLIALLLSAALTASLLVLPAGAAPAAGTDRDTILAVETLRLMGILDGDFRAGEAVNRAQFCRMAACAMNSEDELGLYNTVTIFPDVRPSHRDSAYINMACRKGVIAGYADGLFHPDQTITVGQAVTTLLRMLGYKDEKIGGVWPASYMAVAANIGLTDGVGMDGNAALTQAQAARLFLNLLRSDTAEGGSYLTSVGAVIRKNEVLVTSSATGPDGLDTAMRLASSDETYQMAYGRVSNGALNGCRGTLALDKNGRVLTFVPDAVGESRTINISSAKATQIVDTAGASYTVTDSTKAYHEGEETTWKDVYAWVTAGTSVTLYLSAAGGVDYIFVGGGDASNAAVVVHSDGSTAGFSSLAGSSDNYKIYKNGVEAVARDMRRYDVATYSAATNSIRVCDTRITAYYENCSPNPSEPSEIRALGHDFKVLPTAQESLSRFKIGDRFTLLLTEDNQVAGAVEAVGGSASNTSIGIVKSAGATATVELLCGITVSGRLNQNNAQDLEGQLVRVSSNDRETIGLSRLTGGAGGDLDVAARTLGSRKLADNAMIFENGVDGLKAISLSQLTSGIISSNQISYARTDWADRVDLIVIGSDSGTIFYYGRAVVDSTAGSGDTKGSTSIAVESGSRTYGPYAAGYQANTGDYVGISLGRRGGGSYISALVKLTEVRNVSNNAWSGRDTVTVGGRTYTIPSNVLCYNRDAERWVTLSEAHAYSGQCSLYIHDGAVRIIEVRH